MEGQSSPKKLKLDENSSKGATPSELQAKSPMVGQKSSSKQAPANVNRLLSGSQSVLTKLDQWEKDNDKGSSRRFFEKEDMHLLDPNEDPNECKDFLGLISICQRMTCCLMRLKGARLFSNLLRNLTKWR
jgi:hypothetical protein